MANRNQPRSVESTMQSPVRFENKTDKTIELFWLNFAGQEVSYGKLNKAPSIMAINTFVTHPWIAVDCESKQRLWLNSEEVFYPPAPRPIRVVIAPGREQLRVRRASILITRPVLNPERLMDICCYFISKTMKCEDVDQLPLPNIVRKEIRRQYNSTENV